MPRSEERNGFVREGVPRSPAWVMGEFPDEVPLGLLVQDRKPDSKPQVAASPGREEGQEKVEEGGRAVQRDDVTGFGQQV